MLLRGCSGQRSLLCRSKPPLPASGLVVCNEANQGMLALPYGS